MSKIKVVIVANCQARPLKRIFESLNSKIVADIAIVHLLNDDQALDYKIKFEEADLIVSQLVNDNYKCEFVRTNQLKKLYGSKVISIVNLYFSGYNPDWCYIRVPGKGPLTGPMGDYHNQTIIDGWLKGLTVESVVKNLEDIEFNRKYISAIDFSLEELKARETNADVKISDVVESGFRKKRLFFTFNHPNMFVLREYSKRIFKKAGIQTKFSFFSIKEPEMLNKFIPLVNPAVRLPAGSQKLHRGVSFTIVDDFVKIGSRKDYTSSEIVCAFYSIYSSLGEKLQLSKLVSKE